MFRRFRSWLKIRRLRPYREAKDAARQALRNALIRRDTRAQHEAMKALGDANHRLLAAELRG